MIRDPDSLHSQMMSLAERATTSATDGPRPAVRSELRSVETPLASANPADSGAIPVGAVDWTAEAIQSRVRALVGEYVDFVWRSLRALGVATSDCDDGCQKVWCVVARKVQTIEEGKERSFIFSVVMRVASDMRRSVQAQRKATLGDALPLDLDLASSEPNAEELYDRHQARALLEQLLSGMPWEQRVVFLMFEVEELGLQDIADALNVPRGTVASRLRLAREAFNRALARHQERTRHAEASSRPPRSSTHVVPPDRASGHYPAGSSRAPVSLTPGALASVPLAGEAAVLAPSGARPALPRRTARSRVGGSE